MASYNFARNKLIHLLTIEDNLLRILSDLQDDCMTNLRYEYVYSNLNRELNLSTRLIKTILHNIYDEMSKQSTQYNKLLFTFQNA